MAFCVCNLALLIIISIIIFFLTCTCNIKPLQAAPLDDDQQALLQIKLSLLQNSSSDKLSDWINPNTSTNTTSPCSWSRVTCSFVLNLTRVTGLDLSSVDN
eukprot:c32186_g1_i1 orf=2-301(-)